MTKKTQCPYCDGKSITYNYDPHENGGQTICPDCGGCVSVIGCGWGHTLGDVAVNRFAEARFVAGPIGVMTDETIAAMTAENADLRELVANLRQANEELRGVVDALIEELDREANQ